MNKIKRFFFWVLKSFILLMFFNLFIMFYVMPFLHLSSETLSPMFPAVSMLLVFAFSFYLEYLGGFHKIMRVLGRLAGILKLNKLYRIFVKPPSELQVYTSRLLQSKEFNEADLPMFESLLSKHFQTVEQKNKFLYDQFDKLIKMYSNDRKLDDLEWAVVVKSRKFFNCEIPEVSSKGVSKTSLGDFRARGIISEGRLIEHQAESLPLRALEGEKVFLVLDALFVKRKKVTERINYSGLTKSFNLGGGFRYRIGSIRASAIKKEVVVSEDTGKFFVTSERVGFHGDRKSWNAKINTISDVQIDEAVGLEIFKSGRENPVLIFPVDLDISAAVLNNVLNADYKIDSGSVKF